MRYFMALPIWGAFYVDLFINWALPSMLSAGNLTDGPFTPENLQILMYTTPASRLQLEAHPSVQRLQRVFAVQWNVFVPPEPLPHRFYKHTLMSACYADAIMQAHASRGALLPLVADNIFTEGAFERLVEAGRTADLVMVAGPRIAESVIHALATHRRDGVLRISAPELTRYLLAYPHPHFQACFLEAPCFTVWPSHVYRRLSETCFEAHCYHLHPLLIHNPHAFCAAPDPEKPDLNNLDGHYLEQYYQAQARFAVINEPATLCVTLSLPEDVPMLAKALSEPEREETIAVFANHYCLPVHHYFYTHRLIFEAGTTAELR